MLLILMIPQFAIILPQHKLKHSFVCSLIGQLKYLWRNLHASSFKNPTIRYLHRDHSSWKLFPRIFGNRDLLTRFQIVYSYFFALCGIAFPIGKSPSANFLALFRCARLFALLVHRNEDDTETADAIQKTLLFFCQSSTIADFDNERQYLYMFLSRLFRYLLLISTRVFGVSPNAVSHRILLSFGFVLVHESFPTHLHRKSGPLSFKTNFNYRRR